MLKHDMNWSLFDQFTSSQKHLVFAQSYFGTTVCWNASAKKIIDHLLLF